MSLLDCNATMDGRDRDLVNRMRQEIGTTSFIFSSSLLFLFFFFTLLRLISLFYLLYFPSPHYFPFCFVFDFAKSSFLVSLSYLLASFQSFVFFSSLHPLTSFFYLQLSFLFIVRNYLTFTT